MAGTAIESGHDVHEADFEPDVPPEMQAYAHDQDFVFFGATLDARWALTDRFAISLAVPFRMVSTEVTFLDHEGRPIPDFESIHHRDETLLGMGDVEVGTEVQIHDPRAGGPWTLRVRAGVTFPSGGTEPDPFRLGEEGKEHQHVFFGTGTFSPWLGVSMTHVLGPATLLLVGETRGSVYESREGYRGPWITQGGLGAAASFGLEGVSFLALAEVFHEEAARWSGTPAEASGRTDLLAAAGVTWAPLPELQLALTARTPVLSFRRTTGALDVPLGLGLSAAWTFPPEAE